MLAAALLASLAAIGPGALAAQGDGPPGNNGTVKIHEGAGEPSPEVRNQPHVCTFHLHFFFADPEQSGSWEIQEWAPGDNKGDVVLEGSYDTAGDGEDRQPATGAYRLDDGHYKLFWDGDVGKHDKMKVFWVDCPPQGAGLAPTPTPTPGGNELPAEGTPPPTGEDSPAGGVGGVIGVPEITPPATDARVAVENAGSDAWQLALLGIALLTLVATITIPARRQSARRR